MNKNCKYRVRVLSSGIKEKEIFIENLSWADAVDRFLFYVHSSLELNCSIRCVNIFLGKTCIRLYSNHNL